MLRFERSTDYALIRRILTDPRCYRRMRNDAAPPVELFAVGPRDGIEYIVASEDDRPVALFLLVAPAPEVHCCFTPATWGRTREIVRDFLAWVWTNTPYRRLIGPVPSYNRMALRLAKCVGFTPFAIERNAGNRNGQPFDRILMEALSG